MTNEKFEAKISELEKEILELKNKVANMQAVLDELTRPPDLYLRELARECAGGNWQALKEHNRSRKNTL